MSNIEIELLDFPVRDSLKVRWGEMDAYNIVNNAVYITWIEMIRIQYLEVLQIDFLDNVSQDVNVILGYQDCKYIKPVRYLDIIHLGCRVKEITEFKIIFEVKLFSENYDGLVAISTQEVVTYNYKENRKVKVPERFIEAIENIEKKKFI